MKKPKIILGADHAGYNIKEFIKKYLKEKGYPLEDVGTFSTDRVDYPVFSEKLALEVKKNKGAKGILACGTGIGASIAANKVPGIRAALVDTPREARLSIEHNNANVLTLGGRPFKKKNVKKILASWFSSRFQGGRHLRRINEIDAIENRYMRSTV